MVSFEHGHTVEGGARCLAPAHWHATCEWAHDYRDTRADVGREYQGSEMHQSTVCLGRWALQFAHMQQRCAILRGIRQKQNMGVCQLWGFNVQM